MPGAEWVQADACEVSTLEEAAAADLRRRRSRPPATTRSTWSSSLLAKTEFAVTGSSPGSTTRATSGCFTEAWGVDVAVSTPRVLAALVEEAVTVGDVVRLMSFRKGAANLVEITLPEDTPWVGRPCATSRSPRDAC